MMVTCLLERSNVLSAGYPWCFSKPPPTVSRSRNCSKHQTITSQRSALNLYPSIEYVGETWCSLYDNTIIELRKSKLTPNLCQHPSPYVPSSWRQPQLDMLVAMLQETALEHSESLQTVRFNDISVRSLSKTSRCTALNQPTDNACDPQNMEPNLALNLEVSDLINSKKGNACV